MVRVITHGWDWVDWALPLRVDFTSGFVLVQVLAYFVMLEFEGRRANG